MKYSNTSEIFSEKVANFAKKLKYGSYGLLIEIKKSVFIDYDRNNLEDPNSSTQIVKKWYAH